MLAAFSLLCITMEIARIYRSHTLTFIFLIWNLILAWVPYLLSLKFAWSDIRKEKIPLTITFSLWLLFLPNAPYIITDLIHLRIRETIPMWYDVLLVSSFAWLGLLLALLSMRNVHHKLKEYLPAFPLWCGVIIVFVSSGYGIYVGRFLRWNSWDFFTRPCYLLRYSVIELTHPMRHADLIAVTLIFSLILSLSYITIYLISTTPVLNNSHEV